MKSVKKEILTSENRRPTRSDQIRFIIVLQIHNDRHADFAKCYKREATVLRLSGAVERNVYL